MRNLGTAKSITVYEMTTEQDGFDALGCLCRTPSGLHELIMHVEREDAQRFLHHLDDHRLQGLEVSQQAIDEIYARLKAGRRYAKEEA